MTLATAPQPSTLWVQPLVLIITPEERKDTNREIVSRLRAKGWMQAKAVGRHARRYIFGKGPRIGQRG
jgi:hypothetical protein